MPELATDVPVRRSEERVLALSERARQMVIDTRAAEEGAESLALWVEIAGTAPGGFAYDIYFSETSDVAAGDSVVDEGGITVVVPAASIANIQGATLDVSDEGGETGLVMINPNKPAGASLPPGLDLDDPRLDSDMARRIVTVLDAEVNPAIAAHGGRADLVAVSGEDDTTAFLALSGGCQGCAMSRMTLSQGIETALREAIPELVSVVDVTDHASGANPYF